MDNLHFIPNNILTNFFLRVNKIEKMTINSIISLSVSMHMHEVTS